MEDTLSEELLQGRIQLGREVVLSVAGGKIVLNAAEEPAETETKGTETEKTAEAAENTDKE